MNGVVDERGVKGARGPAGSVRTGRRIAIGLVVIGALAGAGYLLSRATPSWWRPPSPNGAADERARALEQGLASEFTRVRPAGEKWALRLRDADANAWLALRLPRWLMHDRELPWPEGAELVQVAWEAPDRATIGVERDGRIWSATVRLTLANGRLALEPVGGAIGRLPVPWLSGTSGNDKGALGADAFVPELSRPVDAIIELGDGRRVKLLDFEFDDGEARFRFETLPRP